MTKAKTTTAKTDTKAEAEKPETTKAGTTTKASETKADKPAEDETGTTQDGAKTAQGEAASTEDPATQEKIDQAYQDGYSAGFSEALEVGPNPDDVEGEQTYAQFAQSESRRADLGLVCLAMMMPSNQRKGGLGTAVDRLRRFFDGLGEHREDAIAMSHSLAIIRPSDIGGSNFERQIREGLEVLNGPLEGNVDESGANDGQAAADRLNFAFGAEGEDPLEGEDEPQGDEFDADPESPAAAANRAHQAI